MLTKASDWNRFFETMENGREEYTLRMFENRMLKKCTG